MARVFSLAMKSVKLSSMSAVNRHRGEKGELWQPRFFDRALRTVSEYNEKFEYVRLNRASMRRTKRRAQRSKGGVERCLTHPSDGNRRRG